jgi:hypothetical protein
VEQFDPVELDADPQVLLLAAFVRDGVELDGQVIEVATDTWAIAGRGTYDGEVLVSEFDQLDRALWVLAHIGELAEATHGGIWHGAGSSPASGPPRR